MQISNRVQNYREIAFDYKKKQGIDKKNYQNQWRIAEKAEFEE